MRSARAISSGRSRAGTRWRIGAITSPMFGRSAPASVIGGSRYILARGSRGERRLEVWLLDKVSEFLRERNEALARDRNEALARDRTGAQADLELQAATTILLIEAAYGDTEYLWREHR